MAGEFRRFLLVGGGCTALMYLLLIALVDGLGLAATPASAASYLASAVVNYWLNYHWTFASVQAHAVATRRFVAVAAVGLGLNSAMMFVLAELVGIHYLLAQLAATLVVLLWNFAANRAWTFQAKGGT